MSDPYTTTIYYDPSPSAQLVPPEVHADYTWLLILLPIILLLGLFLPYWIVPPKAKPAEKTLREEVDGVFNQLLRDAALFKRDTAVGPLNSAQQKISDILAKRKL